MTLPGPLRKRRDFVRTAKAGRKYVRKSVVVQRSAHDLGGVRMGVTATKKLGNAVTRNRIKRRLRSAFREVFVPLSGESCDYVLIGRAETARCSYVTLLDDMNSALVHLRRSGGRS